MDFIMKYLKSKHTITKGCVGFTPIL